MNVSIIINEYNTVDYLKKTIDALVKNTPKGLYEDIVVVNNSSTDGTKEYLGSLDNVRALNSDKNLNFAGGNNAGSKLADGEIFVFLNPDTEVQPGWLKEILDTVMQDKKIGAVGAKLLFPDGLVQHAGLVISEDKVPRHIYYRATADSKSVNKQREFQAVTAACVAIPKKVFEEVGGFDEEFKNGLEDVDLCLRIREAGYKIMYQPKSVVIHHESVSPGRFKGNLHNADLYMKKWGDKVISDEHKYYREDGFSWPWIWLQDLKNMAYGGDEYGKRPLYVRVLRYIYIPIQKIGMVICLLVRFDFKTLGLKMRKAASKNREK